MEVIHNELDELTTVTPADWVPGPQQGDWTYEAYAALTADGECYEIVQDEQILPSRIVPQMDMPVALFFDWSKGLLS